MDYRDLTALLTRIFGAFMLANVFFFYLPRSIANALPTLRESVGAFLFEAFFPSAIPLVVGLLLMTFPATVSNKLLTGEKLSDLPSKYLSQVERIAFAVLGLFVLSRSSADLVFYLSKYFWTRQLNHIAAPDASILSPDHFGELVAAVFETAFALWLILGARGLSNLLRGIRERD